MLPPSYCNAKTQSQFSKQKMRQAQADQKNCHKEYVRVSFVILANTNYLFRPCHTLDRQLSKQQELLQK
jgi:hypothetical protein